MHACSPSLNILLERAAKKSQYFQHKSQCERGAKDDLCNKAGNAELSLYLENGTHLTIEEVVTVTLRVRAVAHSIHEFEMYPCQVPHSLADRLGWRLLPCLL